MKKILEDLSNQESTGAVKETGRGMGDRFNPFADRADASDQIEKRPNFFSPGGGAFDPRNDAQVASTDLSGISVGDSFTKRAESNLADTKLASAGSDSSGTFDKGDFARLYESTRYKKTKGTSSNDAFVC